jgi:nicotinate-nucleotide adenylyltransferase
MESELKNIKKKRVGIYSGSFNPMHLGHQNIAEYVIENQYVDEVWFVVSPCNPLKNQSAILDEYIRLDMLMLAIRNHPNLKASDIEFSMSLPSYTFDTLQALISQFQGVEFTLIIGCDNALVFDQWKDYKKIINEFSILVYPRKGYDFAVVSELYPQMQLLDSPLYDISSSRIRDFISQKKDVSRWLHPSVNKYIIDNNLYQ